MLNNTPEHEIVRTVRMFTPAYSIFTPTVLVCCARSEIADLPAATLALPADSWHLSRTQWGQGSRPGRPLASPRRPWAVWFSPRRRSCAAPRARREQRPGCTATPARCEGWPAHRTHTPHANRCSGGVFCLRNPRTATWSRPNGPTSCVRGRLGNARRRRSGGLCACGTWQAGPSASREARPRG